MKIYLVKVFNGNTIIFKDTVRSKNTRSAITNVLTNKLERDQEVTRAEVKEVNLKNLLPE